VCEELAHAVRAHDAIIDGEIVCLHARGRSTNTTCESRLPSPALSRQTARITADARESTGTVAPTSS
jgi:ATP-dependent DNA ligase